MVEVKNMISLVYLAFINRLVGVLSENPAAKRNIDITEELVEQISTAYMPLYVKISQLGVDDLLDFAQGVDRIHVVNIPLVWSDSGLETTGITADSESAYDSWIVSDSELTEAERLLDDYIQRTKGLNDSGISIGDGYDVEGDDESHSAYTQFFDAVDGLFIETGILPSSIVGNSRSERAEYLTSTIALTQRNASKNFGKNRGVGDNIEVSDVLEPGSHENNWSDSDLAAVWKAIAIGGVYPEWSRSVRDAVTKRGEGLGAYKAKVNRISKYLADYPSSVLNGWHELSYNQIVEIVGKIVWLQKRQLAKDYLYTFKLIDADASGDIQIIRWK
jgi:hypothetical protein